MFRGSYAGERIVSGMPSDPAAVSSSFGETLKYYRARVAVCFQATVTRGKPNTPTLTIEMASVVAKEAQWQDKMACQVTRKELPLFCATLLGFSSELDAGYHGDTRNHSYHLLNQAESCRIVLREPGKQLFIDLDASERFWVAELALAQLREAMHGASITDAMNFLKTVLANRSARPHASPP